ncbi:ST3 beta-galactoside alpha-2,3-sialyltransferase 3a isoform X2 [Cyclopterus lumpus]|uniref:ST3 beta-galactoside alpha-2,3-sialyltransferase 3a isoform X2 n=1 Tax=Cyclopterus lumpus TaxID=8103 RepID=UPI00148674FA|nr:ST3 beta-galactoside alpha-2,3-sialyltransferase 3a isoform X2 [Cyclopterus lumpus]
MRMKPSRQFFLGLCSMLTLGFLYYSGRISLRGLGYDSLYDQQGFLRKLDGVSLPLELMYKYGNLSEGACKPGFAAAKMTAIYPKFTKLAPMFLNPNYKRFFKIGDYSPPFGVKSQEKIIDILLSATKSYGLGEELDSANCKTCIVVGNGGILANRSLGPRIDEFDVVVRLNEAPVRGFERDVGSKTTMRITYPEGAIQKTERYEAQSLFVLSAFKALDFKWLRHMVFNQRLPEIGEWGEGGFIRKQLEGREASQGSYHRAGPGPGSRVYAVATVLLHPFPSVVTVGFSHTASSNHLWGLRPVFFTAYLLIYTHAFKHGCKNPHT